MEEAEKESPQQTAGRSKGSGAKAGCSNLVWGGACVEAEVAVRELDMWVSGNEKIQEGGQIVG